MMTHTTNIKEYNLHDHIMKVCNFNIKLSLLFSIFYLLCITYCENVL